MPWIEGIVKNPANMTKKCADPNNAKDYDYTVDAAANKNGKCLYFQHGKNRKMVYFSFNDR